MSDLNVQDMSPFQLVDAMVEKTDDKLEAIADAYLSHKLWASIGPVPQAVQQMVTYGMELIAAFPPINSAPAGKAAQSKNFRGLVVGHNEPADWYKIDKKKKAKKDQYKSHSQDLAERTPLGKAIMKQLADIASADVGDSKREATGPYASKTASELAALANYWKPRHTNLVKATRQSIAIVQQLAALSVCHNVKVIVQTTPVEQPDGFLMPELKGAPWAEGKVYLYPTHKPFYVFTVSLIGGQPFPVGARGLTVNELLAWNVEKAGGEYATLETLDKTSSRGTQEGEDDETVSRVDSADEAEEYADELFAFWDIPVNSKNAIAFMKKEAGKDCLTVHYRLYERLRSVFGGDAELRDMATKAIKVEEAAGDPADKPAETKAA